MSRVVEGSAGGRSLPGLGPGLWVMQAELGSTAKMRDIIPFRINLHY